MLQSRLEGGPGGGGGGGLAVQPSRYKFSAEDIAHTVLYLDIQKK